MQQAVQRTLGHASAAMTPDAYTDPFDDDPDALGSALDDAATRLGVPAVCPTGRQGNEEGRHSPGLPGNQRPCLQWAPWGSNPRPMD